MDWTEQFDLFLFDFDGLLVDTEAVHFAAYREMCRRHGCDLHWTLPQYFEKAHLSSTGIRETLLVLFPQLKELPWETLYAEKKAIYQQLLDQGTLQLMPGAAPLLQKLAEENRRRCVVTHSPLVQVEAIQEKLPLLRSIPLWITRECYQAPKPSPEPYRLAIAQLGREGDRIVGFEDSLRGLQALLAAPVTQAVLVCPPNHPQLSKGVPAGVIHLSSLQQSLIQDFF